MVGEKLSYCRCREGERESLGIGNDNVPIGIFNRFGAYGEHLSSSCAYFGYAGKVLHEKLVVGKKHYRRAILVDKGEGSVFQFSKRTGVGVNVSDFFEFERRFRRNGEHVAPSKEKQVRVSCERFRDFLDFRRERKRFFHRLREF